MTPEERAAALMCSAIDAGEFRDDPRFAEKIESRIAAAIREAVKADREQTATLLNAAGAQLANGLGDEAKARIEAMLRELATAGQGMFDKFADIIRERPL